MKFFEVVVLLVALATGLNAQPRKSYEGYKAYRIEPKNSFEVNFLAQFRQDDRFDFWSQPRAANHQVVVMVSPEAQRAFEGKLKINRIFFTVLIADVERVLAEEREHQGRVSRGSGKISFDQYYRYDDIVDYVNGLASSNPDLVESLIIGKTFEGREIVGLKISSGGNGNRPVIFIEAGIHAREWIAPSVALYLINQLVENYENNRDLVDNVDWHIVPVTNPDGYEYTHTNDRFWRKNRSGSGLCKGADANRNFGFHWGEAGASTQPCSETYRGSAAFSEEESSAIRDFGIQDKDRTELYIALHSYGPYFLYPWGYQWDLPDDWEDLDALARDAADAIYKVNRTEYDIGSSTQLLYEASGGSDDWFKGGNGVKYAYTVELPGGGSQGFDPPPSKIKPIVTETFEGLKVCGAFIGNSKKSVK